ncbi:hypothetical protein [Streptomyces sp. NPDC059928]|uniref:hypothetical protein n=1 Tax=unclassified Streptomyces TaxID=2593676 RepID=UPI00366613A0
MKKPDEDQLWQQLAETMNALRDAGCLLYFVNHMGPDTDWWTAPYVKAGNRHGSPSPRVGLDRMTGRWTVEYR